MDTTSFTKTVPEQVPQVRIGDSERQAAARELQQHFAEGRLTWEELDERLAQVYAARVKADLAGLFTDLPAVAPPPPPPPTPRSRAQEVVSRLGSHDIRRLVLMAVAAAVVIGVTRGVVIPVFLIWWFVAGGRHGRRRHHNHHGSHHHGRAWS